MKKSIPNIEESFEKSANYLCVTERYFSPLYSLHEGRISTEHHCVLLHSNKICLITLAPSHEIIKKQKKILKLHFQVTNKVDRLHNKVRGKGKKGGQYIMPNSILCFVECKDGTKYPIRGCIKGKLIEINQLLLKNPDLLVKKHMSQGFIAIILPCIKDFESCKQKLLTQEQFTSSV